eukprot:7103162-Karenia_brevis.AAC.1
MKGSEENDLTQWEVFGAPTLPLSDDREVPSPEVNEEVHVHGKKYWSDRVMTVRLENAEVQRGKQWD